MNLQLLKGVIMRPETKQLKEEEHFKDGPEHVPIALEEVLLRQKIRLEQEMEQERLRMAKENRRREQEA